MLPKNILPFILYERRDEERFILHRGEACYVIMNLYPYNPGHMMVLPFRHTSDYQSLTEQEVREMHRFTAHAVKVLGKLMHPDGFNLGINLRKPASAGMLRHLHRHINLPSQRLRALAPWH